MLRLLDRDALRIGALAGVVLGVVSAAGFAYSNLGPSSRHPGSDNAGAVLAGYGVLAVGFTVFGGVVRKRLPTVRECAVAGATAGVVALLIVAVAMATIDNVWLSTVARQPDKISGLAHSPIFHTMRAYLNAELLLGLVVLPPIAAIGCASCAGVGATVTAHRRPRHL